MFELLFDLWEFVRERRKYWLAPILIVLAPILILLSLLGLLTGFGEASSLAPFIYTLF